MFLDDNAEEFFELTLAKIKEPRQTTQKSSRPIRKIKIIERKNDIEAFTPNVDQVIKKIQSNECTLHKNIRENVFKKELERGSIRIKRVKRGVPLSKILKEENPQYIPYKEPLRYSNIGKELIDLPDNYKSAMYNLRSVDFVEQVSDNDSRRPSLAEHINCTDGSINKLRQIISASDEYAIRQHNEMVQYLNHCNERRERAVKKFYEDSEKYGFKSARARYNRAAQQSRLRVIGKFPWWEEFIKFAYQKPVGKDEEHLIEVISRIEFINSTRYASLMKDVQKNVENKDRCIELLNWINKKCKIIDEHITSLIDDTPTNAASMRRKTLTRNFKSTKSMKSSVF